VIGVAVWEVEGRVHRRCSGVGVWK
jgi:hypothetical protein